MSVIDYNKFIELMKAETFNDFGIYDQLISLQVLINDENIKVFYPKKPV